MKKKILILTICFVFVFVFSGCSERYKRISFEDEMTRSLDKYIDGETEVIYNENAEFPTQLPIYEISKRNITQYEFKQMLKNLNVTAHADQFEHKENKIIGNWVPYTDRTREDFEMSDEDLEKLAWGTFEKIPFLSGDYRYQGIKSDLTISDSEGTHVRRVGVSFRRYLNDLRILGNDRCMLYFDAHGLCEIVIELYEYKEIDTMDLIKFDEAFAKIKEPDYFSLKNEDINQLKAYETLRTDDVRLFWYNQYLNECTILQPVYVFTGTALGEACQESEFTAHVIAIPESYTYKAN